MQHVNNAPRAMNGEWRPIDQQAKSGALILAGSTHHPDMQIVRWIPAGADDDGLTHWAGARGESWLNERYFNRYQPLPPPPAQEERKDREHSDG